MILVGTTHVVTHAWGHRVPWDPSVVEEERCIGGKPLGIELRASPISRSGHLG